MSDTQPKTVRAKARRDFRDNEFRDGGSRFFRAGSEFDLTEAEFDNFNAAKLVDAVATLPIEAVLDADHA